MHSEGVREGKGGGREGAFVYLKGGKGHRVTRTAMQLRPHTYSHMDSVGSCVGRVLLVGAVNLAACMLAPLSLSLLMCSFHKLWASQHHP